MIGRDLHVPLAIDSFAIGRSTAMCNPGAGAGAHDRFDRGDQTAGGTSNFDPMVRMYMDIRFAIGYH